MDEEYCKICFAHIQEGKMEEHLNVHAMTMDIRR